MKKVLALLIILILATCGNEKSVENTDKNQKASQNQKEVDFETIKNFFYEKLKGQTLIRTYGEDTGQTKVIFENGGHFRGDYFGKIAADGKDYGLTDKIIVKGLRPDFDDAAKWQTEFIKDFLKN